MIGLDASQLAAIPQELKEAVCNALVNLTVARVSGSDPEGRILYGRSPRRSIVSGQLLPRFDPTGQDDETSDIRIAALGMDLHLDAHADGSSTVAPRFSVYIRVFPDWSEIADEALGLDIDFKLQPVVQAAIDARIAQLRSQRFTEAGVATPDWPSLNPDQRQRIRLRRSEIQVEVRRQAYREQGIELEQADDQLVVTSPPDDNSDSSAISPSQQSDQAPPAAPTNPDNSSAPLRIGRLLQRGRSVPFALLDPAPAPAKWRRIDLTFAPLVWQLQADDDTLRGQLADYSRAMRQSALQQVTDWINSEAGLREVWRDVRVQPQDITSEQAWSAFRARAAQVPPSLRHVLPALDGVGVQIDRTADLVDLSRVAVRVMLDNGTSELSRRDVATRCEVIFNTVLEVSIPRTAHRPLCLDRVEPSYRFRHFMNYPAIGLNCGVTSRPAGDHLILITSWAPRFVQPRIIPRAANAPVTYAALSEEQRSVSDLLSIPRDYERWIAEEEVRLRDAVREGLSPAEADVESRRLEHDLRDQRREAAFIQRGVRLLMHSQEAYRALPSADAQRGTELERLAAPYRAWLLMNQSFLRREGGNPRAGWRLFQLAFILAHIPTFASHMSEYRDYYDALLDEAAASLLYFPTGGGKSEAFYGTLLFTMFLDRLRGKSRGVTAMIRYPLRLLTLQQGQRLLRLIVFAELIRIETHIGGWPFEIGFWVGGNNTPNRYAYVPAIVPLSTDTTHVNDQRMEEGVAGLDSDEQRDAARYRDFREAYSAGVSGVSRANGVAPLRSGGPDGEAAWHFLLQCRLRVQPRS
jgi:hypothetical protein